VAAMADNIVSVAAQREAMGRAARRHVEDTFSWTRTVRTLLDRYTSAG